VGSNPTGRTTDLEGAVGNARLLKRPGLVRRPLYLLVAQFGRAPGSGPGSRRFKSSQADHALKRGFRIDGVRSSVNPERPRTCRHSSSGRALPW
jgi:hypothetical protein